MKSSIRVLFCLCMGLLFTAKALYAQDTQDDGEFLVFLMLFGLAVVCCAAGAAFVGAFAAALLLLAITAFISLGVLSASVAVGIYNRSFLSGFKTFLYTVCTVVGALIGLSGFWLIVNLFHIDLAQSTTLITGTACGGAGGLLLGMVLIKIIRWTMSYFKNKAAIS